MDSAELFEWQPVRLLVRLLASTHLGSSVEKNDPQMTVNSEEKTQKERRNLALLVIGLVALPSVSSMLPVFSTRIREYFVINAEQYGSLMGMQSLGRMFSLALVGPLVARFGVGRVSEFSFVAVGGACLLLGLGGSLFRLDWQPRACSWASWAWPFRLF